MKIIQWYGKYIGKVGVWLFTLCSIIVIVVAPIVKMYPCIAFVVAIWLVMILVSIYYQKKDNKKNVLSQK